MRIGALLLLLVCSVPLSLSAGEGGGRPQAGAYCPLPEKGEVPKCLAPAQAQYADFFEGLETGEFSETQAEAVESDLQGGDAYLALSSLSYGYYRLAQRAAQAPNADPKLVARLQRWNELLSRVYAKSQRESPFRGAVREAALDLAEQAPRVETRCEDGSALAKCSTASELVVALRAIDRQTGTRAGLGRLLERILGSPP